MSLCLLRTATLVHERVAGTQLLPARLINHRVKRQFERFSSRWSTPVSSKADLVTATPVKQVPVCYTQHQLLHNSSMASKCSCHSVAFGMCTTTDQTLKKTAHSVLIRNMSTELPDERRLNCEELLNHMKENKVLLIDVRSRYEVKLSGLLPDTINIPVREYATAMKFPDQKFKELYGFNKPKLEDHIVFFCASGGRSYIALRSALQMGYKHFSTSTRCYEAEKPVGKISADKSLSYDQLVKLIDRKELYLIDVREPNELQETGELPGSVNIPLNELASALKDISPTDFQKKYKAKKPDMNAPLVFSCRSGARSYKALQTALNLGYMKAKHYKGGYSDWEKHKKEEDS